MPQVCRRFPTEIEAIRFREGVEYANDGALAVTRIYEDAHPSEPWVVLMLDSEAEEHADPNEDLPPGAPRTPLPAADDMGYDEDADDADDAALDLDDIGLDDEGDEDEETDAPTDRLPAGRRRAARIGARVWPDIEGLARSTAPGVTPNVSAMRWSL